MSQSNRLKTICLGIFLIGAGAILCSRNPVVPRARASASGPISGVTGAPMENDCTLCHNTPSGERGLFTIDAPGSYMPGQTYQITLTHVNTDDVTPRMSWGFELTALTVAGNMPVGDLQNIPDSTLTQVIIGGPGGNRQYIEHTHDGVFEGQTGGASWKILWTAPPSDVGPVRLYAAGNQANGDFDNTGDQIYLAQATINPPSCTYSLSSASAFFTQSGGPGSVNLTAPAGCSWMVASNDSWITVVSAESGSGNATIDFEVRENFTASARTGTVTVAGITFIIVQDGGLGGDCDYSVSPSFQSFPASGGTGVVQVFAAERCAWQATPNAGWVTITSGSVGVGNGTVSFSVGVNGSGVGRKTTITIAGKTFSVKQKP